MITVQNESQLKDALKQSSDPMIVIEGGLYQEDYEINVSGNGNVPFTITAASQAIFRNNIITINGNFVLVHGLEIENGMVVVRGDTNRIVKNYFYNGKPGGNSSRLHSAVAIEGNASHNLVDHNEVENWQRRALRNIRLTENTKDNMFSHNHLHGLLGDNTNSGEAFQVGAGHSDQPYFPDCVIQYNLVQGFNIDSEIISLKSSNNLVRFNTFIDCPKSAVSIRAGAQNKIIGNTLIDVMSINVYGDDNRILGNALHNSRIDIRSGDCTYEELVADDTYKGGHPAARRTVVVGNMLDSNSYIRLGKKGTGKITFNRTFPAEDTILSLNGDARIVVDGEEKNTQHVENYSYTLKDSAHELEPKDVGLQPKLDIFPISPPPAPEPEPPVVEPDPVIVVPRFHSFYVTCESPDDAADTVEEFMKIAGVKKVIVLEEG